MASVVKVGRKWYAIYKNQYGIWTRKAGYADKSMTVKLAARLSDESQRILSGDLDPSIESQRIQRAKPVEAHILQFEEHIRSNKRSLNHIQYTILDIRRFVDFSGVQHAAVINIPMVDMWRNHCLTVGYPKHMLPGFKPKPDSVKTVNRRISSLKAFLTFLTGFGGVERNVLANYKPLNVVGHETFNRRAMTKAEVDLLIANTPDSNRKLIYLFALRTGFRRSEIEAMTPSNFNFRSKTITIGASQSKRKTENQQIPMHVALIEPLKAICNGKADNEPVFNMPDKNDIVRLLKSDCVKAGVDPTDIDFHSLRHTFCSLLAESGIRPEVLIRLARHKNLSTTMRYYVHVRPESEAEALNKI
jgi:integrase